jgi:hypothetical protein
MMLLEQRSSLMLQVRHSPGISTPLLGHVLKIFFCSGWTIFRNLYLFNGTWFIVTDEPSDFPLLRMMTSTGAEIWNDDESIKSR